MRMALWIHKTTNTYSEYAIYIAFTQQQWIHERASNVRYTTNIACLAKRSRLTLDMDILFHSCVDCYC